MTRKPQRTPASDVASMLWTRMGNLAEQIAAAGIGADTAMDLEEFVACAWMLGLNVPPPSEEAHDALAALGLATRERVDAADPSPAEVAEIERSTRRTA